MRALALACCVVPACQVALAARPDAGGFVCLMEARQTLEIRSAVEGLIESVPVKRGDMVKKSQVLATLASGQERAALELARSRAGMLGELRAAEARVDVADKKWRRAQELVKNEYVSQDAADEAKAEYQLAVEQLRAARENRLLAELEVKRSEQVLAQRSILSPVEGVVAQVKLRPGELTSSNQQDPILILLQTDPLNVEVVLPVSEIGTIKVGQTAVVMPDDPVGGRFEAKVEVVDANLDASSGTFGVRLTLPNRGNRLPAGARCRVSFASAAIQAGQ
jgi:RND family efflux transporter MFP subunit